MARVDKVQRALAKVEMTIKSFATLSRSTAVSFKGTKFAALFPEDASEQVRVGVWRALVLHPRTLPCDLIVQGVYPGLEDAFPLENDRVTFHLSHAFVTGERKIFNLMQSGIVTVREMDALRWLDDPLLSAREIAASVVEKSVYTCVVVLCPFSKAREEQIRTCIVDALRQAGSGSPEKQAEACDIIALGSLTLTTDAAPGHLLVDAAHRLGTSKHAMWAAWALALQQKNVLQTVELFAATHLLGTEPGFSVLLNMPSSVPTDAFAVRAFAVQLLQARLPEARQFVRSVKAWPSIASQLLSAGTQFFLVARMLPSKEGTDNAAILQPALGKNMFVKSCALLGHNALAVGVSTASERKGARVAIVLRAEVASRLNLRDWISVLEAIVLPSQTFLCIVAGEDEQQLTVIEYIERSRMPFDPVLTHT